MFEFCNSLYDLVMRPMIHWPPELSCALVTVAMSVLLLVVFKYISMQDRIEVVKDKMMACVLGVWIYRDQPRMIGRCQAATFLHGCHYLGLSVIPLLIFAFPMILALSQMNAYYGHRPLAPGDSTLVRLKYADPSTLQAGAAVLTPPDGVRVEATFEDAEKGEVLWRLGIGEEATSGPLRIAFGGATYEKQLTVGDGVLRVEPDRAIAGFWHLLLYPSEPTLPPDGPIESIKVDYAAIDLNLYWDMPWIIHCFIVMLIAILVLRKPMGVAI
ncbi:MAG: hypothetical protein V3T70_11590 [Phycisphaerae bacterium]